MPFDTGPPTYNIITRRSTPAAEEACVIWLKRKFLQEAAWRNMFAEQFEEIAQVIFPEQRNTFFYGSYNFPGMKKTQQQVDSSGMIALWRFGAICDSLLTPANMQWHGLAADDDYVMKDRATKLWFELATHILFKLRYAPTANFSGQNYANFLQLGAFGTNGMFIDDYKDPYTGKSKGLRYRGEPMGSLFITESHQGQVDGMFRWLRMTARQIFTRWPTSFPEGLRGSLEAESPYCYNVIHHVCRRADYDPEAILSAKGKPWASYYFSMDSNALLEEEGYWTFPLACGRYLQAPGEVYGRGPAGMVLPCLKTSNAIYRTYLKTGHRIGDPILLLADDGLVDAANLRPGASIAGGIDPVTGHKLVDVLPTGQLDKIDEMLTRQQNIVDDAFLINLFKVLEENPNMSATAVVELANQKGILMAPTMGRQQSEYLGALIVREMDLAIRQGLLPPMPPRLREAKGEYKIVYTTPLSRTMRAQEVSGSMRTIEMVKEMVAVSGDQSLLDPFAFNRMVPGVADIQAVPASWMATRAEMTQKVKQRTAMVQQKQATDAAPGQAALMNAQTKAKQVQASTPPGTFAPINLQPQPGGPQQ
jgi:hypothetical protein